MKTFILTLIAVGSLTNAIAQSERALIAYMRVQPGTEQTFLKEAEAVVEVSRKESGNLIYELHQSVTNPQQFVLSNQWEVFI